LLLWGTLALALAFLVLPIVAIFLDVPLGHLLSSIGEQSSIEALRLSFECSTIALGVIVVVGTPAAYLLARRSFPGRAVVVTLLELPLVMPPAVAGLGLLVAFGPDGLLGGALADAKIELVLQTAGVVVALVFVAAPFYLSQAQSAFAAIEPSHIDASRTLGVGEAGTLVRVVVPIARGGLLAGVALAWARALGEFGATLMFAGSFEGITQTAPLAIYARFATDLTGARALAAVLVVVSGALLLAVKLLHGRAPLGDVAR
jgi:molybdate transport system permease protein